MESFIKEIASIGEQIIQFSWLPLLIWTFFSGIVWSALRSVSAIHPQYQYHGRLALIFALPVGFISLAVLQYAEGVLLTSSSAPSLSLISVAAPFEMTVTATATNSLSHGDIFYSVFFLFLLFGLALFILRNTLQWFQLRKFQASCSFDRLDESPGLSNHTLELIQQTQKEIRISFFDEDLIPVTFGVRKPVIIVPESIKYDSEKLNLVLRHELTHIIQNDFLSNIAISLTQTVFWFHPFVHVLKRELIDYREIRCDSLVLSNDLVSKKKYASLLLELLPMPNINKELSVNMAQESSNLKKRIQMITQQSTTRSIPKRSSTAIFSFIILCTAIAMSCTDMQTQGEENTNAVIQDESGQEGYFEAVEQMPELIGGLESIQEKITYPEEAKERGIEGPVFIKFIVNKEGNVENAEVMKGIGGGADEEALRVVQEAKFKPGYQEGEPVRVQYTLPISFRLNQPITEENSDQMYKAKDDMPDLKGGLEEIMKNIRYPDEARQAGIEGLVYVQFFVNEEGGVEDANVIRGIGGGADEEALRVVQQAKFSPGYQNGEPVRVQYTLPISFRLSSVEN